MQVRIRTFVRELNRQIGEFLSTKGVTPDELKLTVANDINRLPGEFETSGAVLGGTCFSKRPVSTCTVCSTENSFSNRSRAAWPSMRR